MKTKILTFLLVFISVPFFAQNPIWIMAPKYYDATDFLFSNLPQGPSQDDYQGHSANVSSNAIADKAGNLRAFIIDNNIYDDEGYLIGNLGPESEGRSEVAIVPDPANCDRIYIFSVQRNYSNIFEPDKSCYSILDFSQPSSWNSSRLGLLVEENVVFFNGNTPLPKDANTFISVSKKRADNSHLIFISTANTVRVYKLDGVGLSFLSSFSTGGSPITTLRSEMELFESNNPAADGYNYRIAVPIYREVANIPTISSYHSIFTAKLDQNGQFIQNSQATFNYVVNSDSKPFIKGLEFDKTGRYLFISHIYNSLYPSGIDYVDFTNPTSWLPLNQNGTNDFQNSQIEYGVINGVEGYFLINNSKMGVLTVSQSGTISFDPNFNQQGVAATDFYTPNNLASYTDFLQFNLPDQIDGMNYSTDFNLTGYDIVDYTVQNSATWLPGANPIVATTSNTMYIKNDLIVPAGVTLTIQNMNLVFGEHGRIIVKNSTNSLKGGRLIVKNSTLTSEKRCTGPQMWRGIEVHGDPSLSQGSLSSTKQGSILITDNSVVEHAYIGIAGRKYNKNVNAVSQNVFFSVALNFEGGIIQTSSSTFRNNQTDIELNSYSAPNLANNISSFQNTTFKTDGLLNKPTLNLHPHIKLHRVRGVRITGCDFINATPYLYGFNQQGVGIRAYEASFSVLKGCTNPLFINCTPTDPNRFENLYIGVNATGGVAITNASFTVDGSIFNKNQLGIYALNTQRHRVTNNSFVVNRLDPVNPSNITQTAGLYMKGSTGYTVEGNVFSTDINDPLSLEDSNPYGIVVNNSGEYSNLIYRNQFNDLRIGGQSERINSTLSTSTNSNTLGLQWKCNTFRNTHAHDLSVVDGRIDHHQGTDYESTSLPVTVLTKRRDAANNVFSSVEEDPILFHDIVMSNADHNMRYTHLADLSHTPDSYTISGTVKGVLPPFLQTFDNNKVYAASDGCPTLIRQIGGITLIEWQIKLATLRTIEEDLANLGSQHPDYATVYAEYIYLKRISDLELDEIIYTFLNDTVLGNTNDLLDFIESNNRHDLALQKLALELHLSLNNFSEASTILGENDFDADYIAFITAMIAMNGENPCEYLDSNVVAKEDLTILMSTTENEEVKSRIEAILNFCDEIEISYEFLPIVGSRSDMFRPETATTIQETTQFSLYPNPASESVRLVSKSNEKANYTLRVMNVVGQVVHEDEMNRNEKFINVSAFENGMYIIQIQDASGSIIESIKFLKN